MAYDTSWLNMNRARESGYDPTAQNPRSSAYGADQFIAPTWLTLARRYRPDWKGLTDSQVLSKRADPKTSEEFVGYNNQENSNYLTSKGAAVNNVNLGLAHRFGPAGAMKMLSADPNTPVANLFDAKVIAANPDLKGKSVNDVITGYQDTFQQSAGNKEPLLKRAMGPTPTTQDAKSALGISGPMLLGPSDTGTGIQAPTNESVTGPSTPSSGGYDWGKALLGVGAGLSSIDNPQGAAIALGMLRDRQNSDWDFTSAGGRIYRVNKKTGKVELAGGDATGPSQEVVDANQKADYEDALKTANDWGKQAEQAQTELGQISQLKGLLGQIKDEDMGPAGPAKMQIEQLAVQLGADPKQFDGLDARAAFSSLIKQRALTQRNPAGGGGMPGNFSDQDRKYLDQIAGGVFLNKASNQQILDMSEVMYKRQVEAATEAENYLRNGGTARGLRDHMNKWRNENSVFKDQPGFDDAQKGGYSSNTSDFKILKVE